MSYSSFKKLSQLKDDFGIENHTLSWLSFPFKNFELTQRIMEDMQEAQQESLLSEKAKSEYIVVPILKELRRQNVNKFSTFSGYEFDVDKSKQLSGYCDFVLSTEINKSEVTAPVFCIVEAKDDKIHKGYAQCGAEMYAALLFNEKRGIPRKVIYGCVTNAFSWCFLKLENNELLIDPNYVPLTFTRPHEVLAVLQWILDTSLAKE